MSKETEAENHGAQGSSKDKGRKIHQSHFPVGPKIPLKDESYNSKYEWVDLGKGKWKLVRRSPLV